MSSLLNLHSRPTVVFDVTSKEHRAHAYNFLKARSWKDCPVQFALPMGEDNMYTMIMRQLCQYYVQKEFGELPVDEHDEQIAKIGHLAPRIVLKKKVDNRS